MMRPMIALAIAALTTIPTLANDSDTHGFRPLNAAQFEELKASLLFKDADIRYLRMSKQVLAPHVEELLDTWYGFVGSQPHLLASFSHPTSGKPNPEYLAKVRLRFKAWVFATADARFDQAWLNQQLEFGLRHHRLKKNQTDGVNASDHIAFRHLVALSYPVSATMRPFLERGGHTPEEVAGMHEAWRKAVLLTVILWSQPYVHPGDY